MSSNEIEKIKNRWKAASIIMGVLIIGLIYLLLRQYAFDGTNAFNPNGPSRDSTKVRELDSLQVDQLFIDAENKIVARCFDSLPPRDTNVVKLVFSLKGKSLHIQDFEWNNKDYVSGNPSCVTTDGDNTQHTMTKYIHQSKADSICPFFLRFRSEIAGGNEYEFSLKIFDRRNVLIGKYPVLEDVLKGKILAIALPAIIKTNIKLTRP